MKKRIKNEEKWREPQGIYKIPRSNQYTGVSGREKEKSAECLFKEIMAKNDPNLRKKVCIKF